MKKLRVIWKGIGFYVSLAVVLCLVGGAAYMIRTRPPRVPGQRPMASVAPENTIADAAAAVTIEMYCLPVEGAELLNGYSATEPVWSKTLMQWHIHRGIDFAAPAGEVVMAVADGTVAKVAKDPLLGHVIEISHAGGLVTRYASLLTPGLVKPGERVKKGRPIGAVGSSAASEAMDAPHLHFEAYRDGEWAEILEPLIYVDNRPADMIE